MLGREFCCLKKQSSRKSSRSSQLRCSLQKHELRKISLDYEQELNDLAIKKEKALIKVKQRFKCQSDNLKHVTEINSSITTKNHDAADLDGEEDLLQNQQVTI